jgi:hypothetical protein
MFISTRREFIWSDRQQKYLLVKNVSSIIRTTVALCKGASSQQSALANSQQQFYQTLTNDYNTQFANQNAILGTLSSALNPIIAAGPNQMGYNQAELNTLNSQAVQGTGNQYANAAKALGQQQAAQGGGNSYLPTGAQAAQQAGLISSAANQASNQLLGIKQAGYQQGYNQYQSAVGQLGGVAGMYNPTGYAGQASGAGNSAFNAATQVQQMNNAASPWNLVGGILGGAASAFTGGLTGTLGSQLGANLGGNTGIMESNPFSQLGTGYAASGGENT